MRPLSRVVGLIVALLLAPQACAAEPAFQPNAYHAGPQAFTLPFHSINDHIFIDGAVDGRRGKLMFDTGNPGSLAGSLRIDA